MKKIVLTLVLLLTLTLSACGSSHTVTFDVNGGHELDPVKVENGESYTFPKPTHDTLEFGGWYLDEEFTEFAGVTVIMESDMHLYARWEENAVWYTVTLHKYDDVVEVLDAPLGIISTIEDPVREGYTFYGWYYDSEYTTPYINSGLVTEDTDLYAKWERSQQYVYIVFNNLVVNRYVISYEETMTLEPYELEGFEFEGFYSELEYENEITSVVGGEETIVVYANYTLGTENIDLSDLAYYDYLDAGNPVVTVTVKDMGEMKLQLFPDVAPNSVNNFISYIQAGDYTNSEFHRIIAGFMIQGGIVDSTNCPIAGEFTDNGFTNDLSHSRGVLSMARTNDMDSATSQFFIMHQDTVAIDDKYASFGGLVSGFNVLDLIAYQVKDPNSTADEPYYDIVIESISIELNGYVPDTVVCASTD